MSSSTAEQLAGTPLHSPYSINIVASSPNLDSSTIQGIDLVVDLPMPSNPHLSPCPFLFRIPSDNTHYMFTQAKTYYIPNPSFLTLQYPCAWCYWTKGTKIASSKPHWLDAMHEELRALQTNVNFVLVPRRPHMNVVGSWWVYNTKLKADGSLEWFKDRLIVKGYNQIEGVKLKVSTLMTPLALSSRPRHSNHFFDGHY